MRAAFFAYVLVILSSASAWGNTFSRSDAIQIQAAYGAATSLSQEIAHANRQNRSLLEANCLSLLSEMVSDHAGELLYLSWAIENSADMRDPFDEQVVLRTVKAFVDIAMGAASDYRDGTNRLRGSCPRTEAIATYSDRAVELFTDSYELVRPIGARVPP